MKNKGLLIGLGIVAILVIWAISTQRGLVSLDESVKKAHINLVGTRQKVYGV
jgi:hypothetical protein